MVMPADDLGWLKQCIMPSWLRGLCCIVSGCCQTHDGTYILKFFRFGGSCECQPVSEVQQGKALDCDILPSPFSGS